MDSQIYGGQCIAVGLVEDRNDKTLSQVRRSFVTAEPGVKASCKVTLAQFAAPESELPPPPQGAE